MSTLVSAIISGARTKFNDGLADHFSKDDLTNQVDGTNGRFRVLNQNIIQVADGAPLNFAVYKNAVLQSPTLVSAPAGIFTLASIPAVGSRLTAEYFFSLISAGDYLEFAKQASEFLGSVPTFTAATDAVQFADALAEAAKIYVAGLGAGKMADLSSWFYNASSGNKSFNKDQVAMKFQNRSKELMDLAVKARDDYYMRYSKRNAPSAGQSNVTQFATPYTPIR